MESPVRRQVTSTVYAAYNYVRRFARGCRCARRAVETTVTSSVFTCVCCRNVYMLCKQLKR